jgi:hypothetical protein
VAKEVMMGVYRKSATNADLPKVRGNIASSKGIGEPLITEFLKEIPDVNKNTVIQHIAILKASGDYRWRSPRPRLGVRDGPAHHLEGGSRSIVISGPVGRPIISPRHRWAHDAYIKSRDNPHCAVHQLTDAKARAIYPRILRCTPKPTMNAYGTKLGNQYWETIERLH